MTDEKARELVTAIEVERLINTNLTSQLKKAESWNNELQKLCADKDLEIELLKKARSFDAQTVNEVWEEHAQIKEKYDELKAKYGRLSDINEVRLKEIKTYIDKYAELKAKLESPYHAKDYLREKK